MLIVCCTASQERSTSECLKLKSKLFVKNHSLTTTVAVETLENAQQELNLRFFTKVANASAVLNNKPVFC